MEIDIFEDLDKHPVYLRYDSKQGKGLWHIKNIIVTVRHLKWIKLYIVYLTNVKIHFGLEKSVVNLFI